MSMRFSEDWVIAYQARRRAGSDRGNPLDCPPDEGPEGSLQERIEDYLDERGFYHFHDRSRGKNEPGFLDLVIAMPGSRTIWMELKSKSGRMTKEQKQTKLMLMALGHEVHEVRSFKQFLSIVHNDRRHP